MATEKGLRALHKFLTEQKRGDIVSDEQLLQATSWAPATLKTYVTKNKLIAFLEKRPDATYLVLRNGSSVTYADVHGALAQKTQVRLALQRGLRLRTQSNTYVLETFLGEGATAHVWSANIDGSSDIVAVKIINPRPDLLEPSVFLDLSRRFERESRNGTALAHRCIVDIVDHGKYRNTPFLVMETANTSVKDLIKENGDIGIDESANIVRDCVDGLKYLHHNDCLHRDIKPGNILKTDRGFVLADLGIVRWSDISLKFLEAGTMTTASMELGSANYMAPEQKADAHSASPAADVYSLGVSWYEMVSGDRPLPEQFASGNAPPPTTVEELNELIIAMTNYSADKRPTIDEIDQYLKGNWHAI